MYSQMYETKLRQLMLNECLRYDTMHVHNAHILAIWWHASTLIFV